MEEITDCRPFCPNMQGNAQFKRDLSGPESLTLLSLHPV